MVWMERNNVAGNKLSICCYSTCIASVFVVDTICECRAASLGVFLKHSMQESERHCNLNSIVRESAPDECRRTQAPTRMEWQLNF